jgi:predicted transglutaminase-like protease
MSGLTTSMYYTPLYAPLYVMNDTVCVFDHYDDAILKYDRKHQLIDSIHIDYNHPKNWREWKHEIIVDEITNEAYALYQKGKYYCLQHIDMTTGKIKSDFTLSNPYVDKIKIKNNEVYYVYRPFESLQEKYVYKEFIKN